MLRCSLRYSEVLATVINFPEVSNMCITCTEKTKLNIAQKKILSDSHDIANLC